MLFFPCPNCGGKVESAEDHSVRDGNRQLHRFADGNFSGHAHPLLGVISTAIMVGSQIYQRFPGGGRKRCTVCDHHFC